MQNPLTELRVKNCLGVPGYSWTEPFSGKYDNDRNLTILDIVNPYDCTIETLCYVITESFDYLWMSWHMNRLLCKWFKFPINSLALVRLRPGFYKSISIYTSDSAVRCWSSEQGNIQSKFPLVIPIRCSTSMRGSFLTDFLLLEIRASPMHSKELPDFEGKLTIRQDDQFVFNSEFNKSNTVSIYSVEGNSIYAISLSPESSLCSKQVKTYLKKLHKWSKNPNILPPVQYHRGSLELSHSNVLQKIVYDFYILTED